MANWEFKELNLENIKLKVYSGVYYPAEDTYLLLSTLSREKGNYRKAMDIGCGCGIITLQLLVNGIASYVVACDINIKALYNTKENLLENNVYDYVDLLQCDITKPPFRHGRYLDLIVSNPPYLPLGEEIAENTLSIEDLSWYGGVNGRSVIDAIIDFSSKALIKGGVLFLVQSSISDISKTINTMSKVNLKGKVVAKLHIFFEDIVVIKATSNVTGD